MFPFKWIKEPSWQGVSAQVFVLHLNPHIIQPYLSVQSEWNFSQGIKRGTKINSILMEDHIREIIDSSGRSKKLEDKKNWVKGADSIRSHFWSVEEHVNKFKSLHPEKIIIALVGNGNLLCNPHFVGFSHDRGHSTLYHLESERNFLYPDKRQYTCIITRKEGYNPRVSIETISFQYHSKQIKVFNKRGSDITHELDSATFGQHIVKNGKSMDRYDLVRMAKQGQFYDLRHVFLFGRIEISEQRWLDIGLEAFWHDNGAMNIGAVEAALYGEPIDFNVHQFPEEKIHKAFDAKGYKLVSRPKHPGEYSLINKKMRVCFLEGIYPHNMIGITSNGILLSVVIRGLSNRVGVTLKGAANIMRTLGATDALLIDNGGDVLMNFCCKNVFGQVGARNRFRSIILYCSTVNTNEMCLGDVMLITYPKLYHNNG